MSSVVMRESSSLALRRTSMSSVVMRESSSLPLHFNLGMKEISSVAMKPVMMVIRRSVEDGVEEVGYFLILDTGIVMENTTWC
jgi:hypothetical protein